MRAAVGPTQLRYPAAPSILDQILGSRGIRAATRPNSRAAVVQALIGHDSETIHQVYVSVGFEALQKVPVRCQT